MRKFILSLVTGLSIQQASATVIYSENFDAAGIGSTIAGWAYQGGNIWQVTSDATLDPTANTHVFSNAGNGQQNVGVNFASGTPVTLGGTGDWIKVSFDYRYSATPTSPGSQPYNFFRYGLYNKHGTNTTYDDDIGYLADVNYWDNASVSKDGDWNIRKEINVYNAFSNGILLDNLSSADPGPSGDILSLITGGPAPAKSFDDGATPRSTSLLITRNGFNVDLALYQDGVLRATGSDSASALMNFDTLYFESPSDSNGFALDNLLIETGSVPEPSRMVLLGLGCSGLLLRRRRR
ncbi:MAG: PEP-CTERM sorting domain-containing protein [Prosthecobacter sp.]|uniref:PEP-CTERM sorting domain-containing protein n=1 Tax=Prosthecobacter sp. TaxID=1965333 RepID=UPI003900E9C2